MKLLWCCIFAALPAVFGAALDVENTVKQVQVDSGASIADLEDSFGGAAPAVPGDSELPPPRKNGFYWMLDWNSFLEVGDGDTKVNIRFEPKLGIVSAKDSQVPGVHKHVEVIPGLKVRTATLTNYQDTRIMKVQFRGLEYETKKLRAISS